MVMVTTGIPSNPVMLMLLMQPQLPPPPTMTDIAGRKQAGVDERQAGRPDVASPSPRTSAYLTRTWIGTSSSLGAKTFDLQPQQHGLVDAVLQWQRRKDGGNVSLVQLFSRVFLFALFVRIIIFDNW